MIIMKLKFKIIMYRAFLYIHFIYISQNPSNFTSSKLKTNLSFFFHQYKRVDKSLILCIVLEHLKNYILRTL